MGARYSYSSSPCRTRIKLMPRLESWLTIFLLPQNANVVGEVGYGGTSGYPAAWAASLLWYIGLSSPMARANSRILPRSISIVNGGKLWPTLLLSNIRKTPSVLESFALVLEIALCKHSIWFI